MNMDHRSLLSGEATGAVAMSMRAVLRATSLLYGVGARTRRYQYDTGRKRIHHADVPVISVGNLTTGGTGKTPLVCDLCVRLRELGYRVAIISRGYGAGESGVNDEALEMAERLPDVPHVQHADRVEAARIAVEELESEVLVMDDGFQHRRLHRDLDLVVIDATCPFGFGYLLPRGYLREPITSLHRADAVILSRADQVPAEKLDSIRKQITRHLGDRPLLETEHRPATVQWDDVNGEPIEFLRGRSVALVSAIGNPDAFEQSVRDCGGKIAAHYRLPDHDPYDRSTRENLSTWVESVKTSASLDLVLCTHKDAVKLNVDRIANVPLGYLKIDIAYRNESNPMGDLIDHCLRASRTA